MSDLEIQRLARIANRGSGREVSHVDDIAVRENRGRRHVNMTISLAFLAPPLVQAAVEGRLPRGIGAARLIDAPAE